MLLRSIAGMWLRGVRLRIETSQKWLSLLKTELLFEDEQCGGTMVVGLTRVNLAMFCGRLTFIKSRDGAGA